MRLAYELTIPHLIEFNQIHRGSNPNYVRQNRIVGWLLIGVVSQIGVVAFVTGRMFLAKVCAISVAALVLLRKHYFGPLDYHRAKKFYSNPKFRGLLGRQELTLTPQGIEVVSTAGKETVCWEDVVRIVEKEGLALIYLSPEKAIIIPMSTVTGGDCEQFLAEVNRIFSERKGGG